MSIKTVAGTPERHIINGATMGTRYSASFSAPDLADLDALKSALFAAVDTVDQQMSTWIAGSDLMRLNAAPLQEWVVLPPELMRVLTKALEIGQATNGAFDIALGDLVNAWGFGAAGKTPDVDGIKEKLGKTQIASFQALELDFSANQARRLADAAFDLSGIAKGFAVDQMIECLQSFGIENALVSLDGELRAIGQQSDGAPWAVAVEKPDYEAREPLGVIALDNAAIATSGNYRHWVDIGQTRLSHTMDRQTGGPLKSRLASVTVVADTCMQADAWATALMVMGDVAGPALARAKGIEALFISHARDGLVQTPVGTIFGGML